jgi:hypothetical protein
MRKRLTWILVSIAIALLGVAAFSKMIRTDTVELKGVGISVSVPTSWDGRTYENSTGLRVLQAASVPLSPEEDDGDVGNQTLRQLGDQDIFISVWYWPDWPPPGGNGDTVPLSLPARITRSDFGSFEGQVAPSMAQRVGLVEGKLVQIRVGFGSRTPSDRLVARANAVLRTLAIT